MVNQEFQTSELRQINLLTIQEVTNCAQVRTKTVYRWIAGKKIPAIRLGNRTYRIPEKAIIDYLKKIRYEHLCNGNRSLAVPAAMKMKLIRLNDR